MDEIKQLLYAVLEIEAKNTAEILELQKALEAARKELRNDQQTLYDKVRELKRDAWDRKGCGEVKEKARPAYAMRNGRLEVGVVRQIQ